MLIHKLIIYTFRSSRRSLQALIFEQIALLVFCINNSILLMKRSSFWCNLKFSFFKVLLVLLIIFGCSRRHVMLCKFHFDTGRQMKAKVIAFFLCKPIQSGGDPSLKQNFCLKDKVCGTEPMDGLLTSEMKKPQFFYRTKNDQFFFGFQFCRKLMILSAPRYIGNSNHNLTCGQIKRGRATLFPMQKHVFTQGKALPFLS